METRACLRALGSWLVVMLGTLLVRSACAQELQYSAIDRATVRVLALGPVDVEEVEHDERKVRLASPISGHGSGVLVSKNGLLVTAAHVVAGARAVAVHVPGMLGPLPARVVALDETRDVAFLRVSGNFESVAELGAPEEKLAVRQTVFAIGYPLDVTRSDPQSSRGSVSGRLPDGLLQLDISVNPGNSGGPVVDEKDRVFGIISARGDLEQGVVGLAVAVPLEAFRGRLQAELKANPEAAGDSAAAQMADLVSLVAHEGGRLMRGSVEDDAEAGRAEREVRRLLKAMPKSADAALLGAAFFWNRYAIRESRGTDKGSRRMARRLVDRAVALDPELERTSRFVKFMLAGAQGTAEAASAGSSRRKGEGHDVHFGNDQKDAVLYVKSGEAEVTTSRGELAFNAAMYEKLCDLPCDKKLPSGKYYFAVKQGDGRLIPVSEPVTIDGPTKLRAEYESNKGIRNAGIGVMVVGGIAGAAVMLLGTDKQCRTGEFGIEECDTDLTGVYVGCAIGVGAVGIGYMMMAQSDSAAVGPPNKPPSKPPTNTVITQRSLPPALGLSLRGTF